MENTRKSKVTRGFLIMLVLLIVMTAVNWGVVTGWGNVKIDRLNLNGTENTKFSALLYVPKNATNETPAPALICFHGNAGNARNHESWAVEFARRGFVVLSVDEFGSGNSSNFTDEWLGTQSFIACGDVYYRYMLGLQFVDQDNILVGSHSMGNSPAFSLAGKYNAKAVLAASPVTFRMDQEYMDAWANYKGNYLNATGAVEAAVVKRGFDDGKVICLNRGYEGFTESSTVEEGKVYGSFKEGNAFCFITEANRIHEAAFVRTSTIGNILWFGQESVGKDKVPNYIDASDQIWMYKDYIGLASILVFGAFICALALFLIEKIPAFNVVRQPVPRNIGLRGVGLWISIVCGIVFPFIVLKTGCFGLSKALGTVSIKGFQLGFSNQAFATIIGLNVMGLITFILFLFTDGKKQHITISDLGLTEYGKKRPSWNFVLKTLLLSAIVIAISWAWLQLQAGVLGTDYYAWFFGFKDIPLQKVPYYTWYIVIWIVCFIIASFSINVERRLPSTGNETLDIIIAIVFNIVIAAFTVTLVIIMQWTLEGNNVFDNAFWETMGIDVHRLWGMPVGMAVGVGGSSFLYRKTGNTWLSAMLMGTVAALECVLYGQIRVPM